MNQYNKLYCRFVSETNYMWIWKDFRAQGHSNFGGNGPWFQVDQGDRPGGAGILLVTAQTDLRVVEVWVTSSTDIGPLDFHFARS